MTTTVAQLIAHLRSLPQDAVVVLAKHPDGSNYASPGSNYAPLTLRIGDAAAGPGWHGAWGWYQDRYREYAAEGSVPAVCLWPTN